MSRRNDNTLKKIVRISEDWTGTSCQENGNELPQNEDESEILESDGSEETEESLDSEKENFRNFHRNRKRMHILHDSETKKDENISRSSQNLDAICDTEIALDEIIWKKLEIGGYI